MSTVVSAGEARRRARSRATEWPTVALAIVVYGLWLGLTWYHAVLPWPALLVGGGWVCAWHSSLQHELVHGHPTRWARINRLIGLPPLLLWLPFDRYRALHLTHHREQHLTDPLRDPEAQYFSAPAWHGLGRAGRLMSRACARLSGRVLIGPAWAIGRFLYREMGRLRADLPGVRAAWLAHAPALGAVLAWLAVCRFPMTAYVTLFVLPGTALLLLRSLAEHRATPDVNHRTAIVEQAPVLGLLFLYNNLHAVHHERPGIAWYRLPGTYRRERERLVARNGGLVYAGYADVARKFLFRAHDQAVHPFLPK